MVAHAIAGSPLWTVKPDPQTARDDAVRESLETAPAEAAFDASRRAVLALLGFSPEESTVIGGNGDPYGLAGLFLRLLALSDADLMAVVAVVMGESLAVGSAAVEAAGLHLGVDMAAWWSPDPAFFGLIRDREVLGRIVAEVAGETVAAANADEKGKTLKAIIADHLEGRNGRAKAGPWVPRWMAFPPAAYTARGGVGTVAAHALVAAAAAGDDPGPDTPAGAMPVPDETDAGAPEQPAPEPVPLAA